MLRKPKIVLMTLGEELLLGLTANGHLTFVGNELRKAGANLHANVTISDSTADIESFFRLYWERADVLITTGGLGPTVDDRTKEVIAQTLGENLVFDPESMEAIEARFQALGKSVSPNNRKQAYRFENGKTIPNENGTAPGLWLEKDGKVLIMLPGPPNELQPMLVQKVLPELRKRAFIENAESYIQIRTTGLGESALETLLQPVTENEDGLEVAFCAHPGMVDFRLSFPNHESAQPRLLALAEKCRALLGDAFLTFGDDTLVDIVSKKLRQNKLTLAAAESCTGGYLANQITNLSGSSEYFLGGIASYSESAKNRLLDVTEIQIQTHTAVSEEVAIAMVEGGAKNFGADFCISTTGYLSPSGGTEKEPNGTVYIGLKTPSESKVKRFVFRGDRVTQKRRISNAVFEWLNRELDLWLQKQAELATASSA